MSDKHINQISQYFDLTIIESEGRNDARARWNRLETDFPNQLKTMDYHGGMNVRKDYRKRKKVISLLQQTKNKNL